jgi:hypothetical protein
MMYVVLDKDVNRFSHRRHINYKVNVSNLLLHFISLRLCTGTRSG